MSDTIFNKMAEAIIDGEIEDAKNLANEAIQKGLDPLEAINQGYIEGITKVGEMYQKEEIFLPQLIVSARAMQEALALLEPELEKRGSDRDSSGKILIGTVKHDIHEIGKNILTSMFAAYGYQVVDLGVDVDCADFVAGVKQEKPDILALSALLTTTMPEQKKVIEALKEEGITGVKVIIGGAPVNQDWADEIGADGFGEDAISAVELVKELMG